MSNRSKMYREFYAEVFQSDKHYSKIDAVKRLAQLVFNNKFDGAASKEESVWVALELLEEMTGRYLDPTHDEFDEIKYSIVGKEE